MKKLNLLRLLFGAMFLIAATAFTSCVDDNDDDGMPYLEVAPEALTFSAEGVAEGASAVTVEKQSSVDARFRIGRRLGDCFRRPMEKPVRPRSNSRSPQATRAVRQR